MRKILSVFAFLVLAGVAWCQEKVSGVIKDQNGDIVPYATVSIPATNTSVSADGNANFTIPAKPGDLLKVSAVGFQDTTITIGSEPVLNIVTRRITTTINDVVVTTALGVQRQAKELGYATTTISNKTLTQAKAVNIQQALNGKISGLNISTVNSGVFENAKINIRGIRSLTGNNQPMLVVDGAPTPLGYLSSIPPDDVSSLTVLKSAASAAIYGPDAVNGVIIVNTKRGGKPTVTVSSTIQATQVSFFPKFQKSFGAGAGEYTDPFGNYLYVPFENQQYGPKFDGSMQPIGGPIEDGSQLMGAYSNDHYKDKVKFWNSGITFQNSASIAGQDFYISIQDANIKGLVPDDHNRRTSFRFNGNKKYGKFSVSYGLTYILNGYNVFNEAALANISPAYNGSLFFLVMQTPSNVPLLDFKDWNNNKFAQYSNYWNEYAINPYWAVGNLRQKGTEHDVIGDLMASFDATPWLRINARLSTNLAFQTFENTTAPIFVSDWAKTVGNPQFPGRPRNSTQYVDKPGNVFNDDNSSSRINLDYFLNGQKDIGKDWTVKYVLGGMVRENKFKDVAVGGNNLVVPYLYNVAVRSGDAFVPVYTGSAAFGNTGNNYKITSTLLGAYGTIGFNYKGWGNIELTGRNDWDSRLLKENRSFFYPAVNVAAVLSDAIPAIKDSRNISYLKVRAAFSKSGNVNLGPYSLQPTYSAGTGFPFGNTSGFTANQTVPSPDLKPEFVQTYEAGIEMGFVRNRINFEATYYYQKNTDQVLTVTQSITTGYTSALANAADFKNYGVEMDLNLTPLVNIGRGRIDFKINASYNNNQITKTLGNNPIILTGTNNFVQIATNTPTANNIGIVGGPAFAFQLSDYLRDPETGKVIIDPATGYPSADPNLIVKGRSLPLWILGFTPSYSIGNFSFTMTWDYKGGHNFYSGMGADEDFAGISARSAEYNRQRFVFPNSVYWDGGKYVPNTAILVQDGNSGFWTGGPQNTSIGTNYYASAAAWRLREVNISYDLPVRWFGKNNTIIKRFTVSAVGKNLFLFVPKSNQWGDPEFNYSTTGNTFGLASSFQSPASRLFGGSITVQF